MNVPISTPRNAPCPCKSGKKFKKCCDGLCAIGPECRRPAVSAGANCLYCGARVQFCEEHFEDGRNRLAGHVLRLHPEKVPDAVQELAADESRLALIDLRAQEDPAPWARLMRALEKHRKTTTAQAS